MKAINERSAAPIKRVGGKGRNAKHLIPHFAAANTWIEPFFGSGAVFFQLPARVYSRFIVNDLHKSLVNFFKVLRDRPQELTRVCKLTPYAHDEFIAALEISEDPLEEARRFWVRSRFSFGGIDPTCSGNWARVNPVNDVWVSDGAESALAYMETYAQRIASVHVTNQDAVEIVDYYGKGDCMVYCDPPYVASTRTGKVYEHEMTLGQHERLLNALRAAVSRGARVAISGYDNELYNDILTDWRSVSYNVALAFRVDEDRQSAERVEKLWMSYPQAAELQCTVIATSAKPSNAKEASLLKQARHRR